MAVPVPTVPVWQIIITSSLCAAVASQGITIVRDIVGSRNDGKIAALYAAMSLERYAAECLARAADRASLGRWAHIHFPDFRKDIDMKAIGTGVAQRLLGLELDAIYLPNLEGEVPSEEMRMEWALMAISMGQRAIAMADFLRRKFWLGPSRGSNIRETRDRLNQLAQELSLSN